MYHGKKNRDENLVIGPRKNTLWQERNWVKIAQLNIIKKIQWSLVTWIWEEYNKSNKRNLILSYYGEKVENSTPLLSGRL